MKISVTVKPNAREEKVEKISDGEYRVAVHESAHEGKANEGIVRLLAEYFDIPRSSVRIVTGYSGRKKIIEIG